MRLGTEAWDFTAMGGSCPLCWETVEITCEVTAELRPVYQGKGSVRLTTGQVYAECERCGWAEVADDGADVYAAWR